MKKNILKKIFSLSFLSKKENDPKPEVKTPPNEKTWENIVIEEDLIDEDFSFLRKKESESAIF